MKAKLIIRTPKGQASISEAKISKVLIGKNKVKMQSWISPDDDEIAWEVEGEVRPILNLTRNVYKFDIVMKQVLSNKMLRKTFMKDYSKEQIEMLDDMLLRQTTVEIIKEATAEELVEANKTFWTKLKEKFTKQ